MTLAVVFRRAARRELDEAALWYEERRPGLGVEFVSEINRAVYLLAENPECTAMFVVFGLVAFHTRCSSVRNLVVLSVFHARRDPGMWQRRA